MSRPLIGEEAVANRTVALAGKDWEELGSMGKPAVTGFKDNISKAEVVRRFIWAITHGMTLKDVLRVMSRRSRELGVSPEEVTLHQAIMYLGSERAEEKKPAPIVAALGRASGKGVPLYPNGAPNNVHVTTVKREDVKRAAVKKKKRKVPA